MLFRSGACIDSAVKQIEVKPTPNSLGFISTIKGQCGAPVAVDFRDTTADAVAWQWKFDYTNTSTVHSTIQAPTHTFTENRLYYALLNVTNSAGCSKEIVKGINLPYPYVTISYTSSSGNPPTSACGPLTIKWRSTSTWQAIAQYRWEFGDGGTSTEAEPEHTFSKPGDYQIKLHYTTDGGCTGTAYFNSITISGKPEADFKIANGTTVCGNTPVQFVSQTTGFLSGVNWYINGDNLGPGLFSVFPYRFSEAGKYTVKLVVFSGMCSDTAEKIDYVEVLPPFPKIDAVVNTCEGTRGLVTINQSSREALSWKWDFGDGNSTTLATDQPSITHTYAQTGAYKVVLTTTNGVCSIRDSTFAYVMLKKDLTLTTPPEVCMGTGMNFTVGNLQENPYPHIWNYNYYFARWEYEDGTPFTGYSGEYYIDRAPTHGGALTPPDPNKKQLRVILKSIGFDCPDTSNFTPIKIVGVQAALDIVDASVCFNTPVTFNDVSVTTNSTIVQREWNFGDGRTQITTGATVTHTYAAPGTYYVLLKVTDNSGCSSYTPGYTQYVTVTGPLASFTPSGTNVPLNTTVSFYNNTNAHGAFNTTYQWDFGNGSSSTQYSPSHTFTQAGTYTVKLTATDAVTNCSSQYTQVIVVKDFNSAFSFNTSYITGQSCPPVLVRLQNTSVNYTRVTWDFGDGITADNVNFPSHIYEKPGKYIITLFVYGPNGLKGTYTDSVVIQQPRASMLADDLEGCIGNVVTLHAKADSTKSYIWDFGDGHVITTTDSFHAHQYNIPGIYSPSLLIKDANGCAASSFINDKITIRPDPVVSINPGQPVLCLGQAVTLEATGGVSYSWSPGDNLSNSAVSSPVANPSTTTTYSVQVADDIGCTGSGSVTVNVVEPVTLAVPADMSVCAGNSVVIPAAGAVLYTWINNTTGLNDTKIANPTATPGLTTTYTVTGSDAHLCFSDTAEVTVRVLPLPTVNAGADMEVQAGTPIDMAPTYSNDVIQWTWSPATYLNCSNCPNPVSTPLAQTQYTLTVKNNVGCFAKDSVLLKMICDEARVAIPNAFSPNGDGKNDQFIVKGISMVKHLMIYNRWGQKVFERSNFIAADRSACWDGTLKGYPASPGTYVYFVEMECPSGGGFLRKGSFVLVR